MTAMSETRAMRKLMSPPASLRALHSRSQPSISAREAERARLIRESMSDMKVGSVIIMITTMPILPAVERRYDILDDTVRTASLIAEPTIGIKLEAANLTARAPSESAAVASVC